MPCKNQGNFCKESDHCQRYLPQSVNSGVGVSTEYIEYPQTRFRNGNYNIPGRTGDAVMYPSVFVPYDATNSQAGDTNATATCGKIRNTQCRGGLFGGDYVYDYYPNELSFDWQSSDTWISYLYDTSNEAGAVGDEVYYIHTCTTTTSTSTPAEDPLDPPTEGSSETSTVTCVPCTAHSCSPAKTNLRYTYNGKNITNDDDCPYPDLFGIGTESNKIAFRYDSLSTTLPDGVTDFAFSYDGVTYVDVYDETLQIGQVYTSSQNPWQSGDESFSDFVIYDDIFESSNKTGLRVKVRITPIFDDTGPTLVFSGTEWEVMELLNPGSNYAINDVFTLEYEHTHPDQTTSTLSVNMKITAIGPVQVVSGQDGFDVLRTGDTINGHQILRVYHTDLDNFPYHVAYLDGEGNDFTKDTQYTSSRNHVITAKAGYGIVDRAILLGRYEFLEKSIQYVVTSIDKNSPDVFNGVVVPEATATVTNGAVTGFTITETGANLTRSYLNGEDPVLTVAGSPSPNGKDAVIEGIFVGGQLSSIKIISGGTLYSSSDPPRIFISNTYKKATTKYSNEGYEPGKLERYGEFFDALPGGVDANVRADFNKSADSVPKDISFTTQAPNTEVKFDTQRRRADVLAQRLYSKPRTDPLYDIMIRDVNLDHLSEVDFKDGVKALIETEEGRKQNIRDVIGGLTQERIPEYNTMDEVYVETVQGRVGDLPYSSQYTKYILRQYRADPSTKQFINVTLSCEPVDPGIDEVTCPPPTPLPGGSTGPTTDPITGTTSSSTTTCTVTGPHGPGCQAWEISGQMLFLHDLTRSAATVVDAAKAYGNPLLQT